MLEIAPKTDAVASSALDPALAWARQHFAAATVKRVTNHTWATTYRLCGPSSDAYLKRLHKSDPANNIAIAEIARRFDPHVPTLVAAETDRGFFVFKNHGGADFRRKLNTADRTTLLSLYGRIQGQARAQDDLLANLPKVTCTGTFDELIALMHQAIKRAPAPGKEGNPFLYMRRSSVRNYETVFTAALPMMRAFLATGDTLPATLNHCDLRAKNIARRADGSLCIFDWDDAVQGPPGLSLHAQFSGCTRVFAALTDSAVSPDAMSVSAYIEALTRFGRYDPRDVAAALPAATAAGAMRYILGFAAYPVSRETSRQAIVKNVRRRLSDLMDLMVMLAQRPGSDHTPLIKAFVATGRKSRGQMLSQHPRPDSPSPARVRPERTSAEAPDVFPAIEISPQEREKGRMSRSCAKQAETLFNRHGALLIKNAFSPDLIAPMQHEFDLLHTAHQAAIQEGKALRVGDKRFMISLELKGAFAAPEVLASPFVLPLVHRLLSKDAILGSFTAVASMPGSKDQSLHRDNPPLFEEKAELDTPCFCIALIIPLIALDAQTGATRIIKGSHRSRTAEAKTMPSQDPVVDLGACYMMDSRLFHQGMANNSDRIRPILSLVYQRPWYRDHKNFKTQSPLMMSDTQRQRFPRELRKLVSWAGEPI